LELGPESSRTHETERWQPGDLGFGYAHRIYDHDMSQEHGVVAEALVEEEFDSSEVPYGFNGTVDGMDVYEGVPGDLDQRLPAMYDGATVAELLAGYAAILAELRRQGVVRTNNAPAGDYAEWLVEQALNGTISRNRSEKAYDLMLADGRRVQVKARVVSSPPKPSQLASSVFRSFKEGREPGFDVAALVLLRERDYRPVLGVLVPVDIIKDHSHHRPHVNGHIVFIKPPLTTAHGVEDITELLVAASMRVSATTSPE